MKAKLPLKRHDTTMANVQQANSYASSLSPVKSPCTLTLGIIVAGIEY